MNNELYLFGAVGDSIVLWSGDAQGQLDPQKEAAAAQLRVAAGFSTRERVNYGRGADEGSGICRIRIWGT